MSSVDVEHDATVVRRRALPPTAEAGGGTNTDWNRGKEAKWWKGDCKAGGPGGWGKGKRASGKEGRSSSEAREQHLHVLIGRAACIWQDRKE
jgi:hypothetical protein